jgi:hypothetical protein
MKAKLILFLNFLFGLYSAYGQNVVAIRYYNANKQEVTSTSVAAFKIVYEADKSGKLFKFSQYSYPGGKLQVLGWTTSPSYVELTGGCVTY